MSILNLFRRSSPTPVASRPLPYSRLSLRDWQASPERVSYVQELFKAPLFLDLVGMLSNVRPPACDSLDSTTSAILLGQRIGHDQVIATILQAAMSPPKPHVDVPIDYDAKNVMATWDSESEP